MMPHPNACFVSLCLVAAACATPAPQTATNPPTPVEITAAPKNLAAACPSGDIQTADAGVDTPGGLSLSSLTPSFEVGFGPFKAGISATFDNIKPGGMEGSTIGENDCALSQRTPPAAGSK